MDDPNDASQGSKADRAAINDCQATPTGIRWVDAMIALVRPSITFVYFGLYVRSRIASLAILAGSDAIPPKIVAAAWMGPDMEVLSGILSFWFLDRILQRARR